MTFRNDRWRRVESCFATCFRAAPEIWVRAPGRVDLMGSHTDYNLGYVLTLPIGRDTWIAARPRTDGMVRLYSMNLDAETSFDLSTAARSTVLNPRCESEESGTPLVGSEPLHVPPSISQSPLRKERDWSAYIWGVAEVLKTQSFPLQGFDGVVQSTVPIGSGLSSSAALECAVATVFEILADRRFPPVQKAILCQRAENEFVGVQCGLLDQYTACVGRAGCALLLDCRDLSSRPIRLPPEIQVVICDTRAPRELSGSEYGVRRAQCEDGARRLGVAALRDVDPESFQRAGERLPLAVARRCRFIVEENARVLQMAEALDGADHAAIARLTAESFDGACQLYEIGVPAMHAMMRAMTGAPGVIGARQAGAGFGGCMVAFVRQNHVGPFIDAVCATYDQLTGVKADVYPVEAASGAGPLAGPTSD